MLHHLLECLRLLLPLHRPMRVHPPKLQSPLPLRAWRLQGRAFARVLSLTQHPCSVLSLLTTRLRPPCKRSPSLLQLGLREQWIAGPQSWTKSNVVSLRSRSKTPTPLRRHLPSPTFLVLTLFLIPWFAFALPSAPCGYANYIRFSLRGK